MNKHEEITLKSDSLNINKVERFVEQICDQQNIYNNYYANILMSVIEAYTNAVEHGNKYDENKSVRIVFDVESNGLSFRIKDEGEGFDFNAVPDPTDIANEGAVGRGIFMIKSLSDELEFEDGGRTLKLRFLISSINREISNRRVDMFQQYVNQGVKKSLEQ